ncbi:MAG: hypothetical protein KKA84_07535 [Bacteroidetes bacterium]|nr:hypothetical protein [Bacteroidota bacterium]
MEKKDNNSEKSGLKVNTHDFGQPIAKMSKAIKTDMTKGIPIAQMQPASKPTQSTENTSSGSQSSGNHESSASSKNSSKSE